MMLQKSKRWLKSQKVMYSVLTNSFMTLETVTKSRPGSIPYKMKFDSRFSWKLTFCCYKRRDTSSIQSIRFSC